ncbi:MAG TPA: polysaccharide deacetylase family protein [Allosphingosinicella sp.]|nr:polysaccharide deacetylase family protein [Allosphingosinicella sp.]
MTLLRLLFALLLLPLAAACATITGAEPETKRIALTFDDIPRQPGAFFTPDERTQRLIAGLRAARVRQAAFFVNPGSLAQPHGQGGERRIADYVRAGHVLANHSFSHPALTAVTAEAYLADIDRAEDWLRGREGRRPWFRFPYLNEGRRDLARRDAIRAGLAQRGLQNGYVTVDGSDWNMEQRTIDAVRSGLPIDREALQHLYIETHVEAAEFYDGLARRTIGRSPAHVLLLHETDLAALWIADLVAALRARGWEIVTADEAFADPLRTVMPNVPVAQGTLIEAIAWEKGLPAPRWYERNNLAVANRIFSEQVLHDVQTQP